MFAAATLKVITLPSSFYCTISILKLIRTTLSSLLRPLPRLRRPPIRRLLDGLGDIAALGRCLTNDADAARQERYRSGKAIIGQRQSIGEVGVLPKGVDRQPQTDDVDDGLSHLSIGVGEFIWVVVGIRIPVQAMQVVFIRLDGIDAEEPAERGVVVARAHVDEAGLGVLAFAGEPEGVGCCRCLVVEPLAVGAVGFAPQQGAGGVGGGDGGT